MDIGAIIAAISAAKTFIDSMVVHASAQDGLSPEEQQQILEAAGREDAAWDDRVAQARARLGRP